MLSKPVRLAPERPNLNRERRKGVRRYADDTQGLREFVVQDGLLPLMRGAAAGPVHFAA
jgi:hypothetical protein